MVGAEPVTVSEWPGPGGRPRHRLRMVDAGLGGDVPVAALAVCGCKGGRPR